MALKASGLLPSIHSFLVDCGLAKTAKALAKESGIELSADPTVELLDAANLWLAKKKKKKEEEKVVVEAAVVEAVTTTTTTKKRKRGEETKEVKEERKRREALAAVAAWEPQEAVHSEPAKEPAKPFSRLGDESRWLEAAKQKDNSYAATFDNGGFGARASEKLIKVRGKDFRHGKTKMKRKNSWGGGNIDLGSNSLKFED